MKLFYFETITNNPYKNLAFEETLMETLEQNSVCLFLWQNENTVVIGRNQNPWNECRVENLEADKGTLARRSSGGGCVFHDLGNLNFTFVASKDLYDLNKQLKVIVEAVNSYGIDAKFTGRNDITVDEKKFSGNAFMHNQNCSLHHGTLLINTNMDNLKKYLNVSQEKMKSKGIKSVKSRVCNLSDFANIDIDDFKTKLVDAFEKVYQAKVVRVDKNEVFNTDLYKENYNKQSSKDWIFGKSPKFNIEIYNKFTWAEIKLLLEAKNGVINNIECYSDAMDVTFCDEIKRVLKDVDYNSNTIYNAIIGIDSENAAELADFLKKYITD